MLNRQKNTKLFSLGFQPGIKPVFFIFLIIFFHFSHLHTQENLVPNGSFEEIQSCPVGADIEKALGWFSFSNGTPDIYNSCADMNSNLSVPENGYGFQYAQEGKGYVGIVCYGSGFDYREYAGVKLKKPLDFCQIYKVSFFLNLPEYSPFAVDNVTIGFFQDTINANMGTSTLVTPNFVLDNDTIILDTSSWVEIVSYYISTGKENYLCIGNFKRDDQIKVIQMNNNQNDQYYFIDNVSVSEVNLLSENLITPNEDGINDVAFYNPELKDFEIEIYNRWGSVVKITDFSLGWDGYDSFGKELSEGVYFYKINLKNQTLSLCKTGFIHLLR